MKKILLLLLLTLSFSGCEKDDICVDETTPRLILEFYDASNPANLKNVTNLKVTGFGLTNPLKTFNAVSVVELPLKTTEDVTKYGLILNSTSTTPGVANLDYLEFNYTRNTVFVSRACGYKTIFELNSGNGVLLTDAETPDLEWIQSINIQTNNIETEDEVHIKIYF
ncbi:hypothetical protein HKT18_11860 [Flavobacterium sp. IMCC34852]|uniref:Lipoprotein n=1 Tax=Flavobacterium rivulicola TaxID=2732161 RepID=A0A7Y3RAG8_9FLAO|nr:DUF6452 family protein [Flavobacterium sp. IMCC34852]NNT72914.1 hypothetical protein [Flavobacterium sp. IMCC34852]